MKQKPLFHQIPLNLGICLTLSFHHLLHIVTYKIPWILLPFPNSFSCSHFVYPLVQATIATYIGCCINPPIVFLGTFTFLIHCSLSYFSSNSFIEI